MTTGAAGRVDGAPGGRKPRGLDLFSGAGGASHGYALAGFEMTGVDNRPQPRYPYRFILGDALEYVAEHGREYDFIAASPPCQAYTSMNNRHGSKSPELIAQTRELLEATGLAFVIENVAGAAPELRNSVQLCGRALGLEIHRHRLFETNWPLMVHACKPGRDRFGIYGKLDGRRLWTRTDGSEYRAAATLEDARAAMGIDWMDWDELREAIPPAMTEHVGSALMAHLQASVAA